MRLINVKMHFCAGHIQQVGPRRQGRVQTPSKGWGLVSVNMLTPFTEASSTHQALCVTLGVRLLE